MDLFYSHPNNISDNRIFLSGDEAHHLINVSRKSRNDLIIVTDGIGNIFNTKILEIIKKEIVLEILSSRMNLMSLPKLTFCIPLLKNPGRFEFMLEKLTELGVNKFFPFTSEHSVVKYKEKDERWQKILISAIKQSNNPFLPEINKVYTLDELLNSFKDTGSGKIMGMVEGISANSYLKDFQKNNYMEIVMIVGPEGDFSKDEYNSLIENGFQGINLGGQRLRSETAAITLGSFIAITK